MEYAIVQKKGILYGLKEDFVSTVTQKDAGDYPLHFHEFYEIEMVVQGSGSQIFQGEEFPLRVGDIYLVRPGDSHSLHFDEGGLTVRKIQVKGDLLPHWVIKRAANLPNPIVYHLSEGQLSKMVALFELAEEEMANRRDYFMETSSLLCELIFTYFFRLERNQTESGGDAFVRKVTFFLQHGNRFTKKVTLDEIAEYVGYSKFYTSSMFSRFYGKTIQEFLVEERVNYAKHLLEVTDYPVSQIVTESGFSSVGNFYPQFQRLVGCKPLDYRKRLAKEKEQEQNIEQQESEQDED